MACGAAATVYYATRGKGIVGAPVEEQRKPDASTLALGALIVANYSFPITCK